MPAILTHDFFGKDVLANCEGIIGSSEEERRAFLLGNQGPDPFFYSIISNRFKEFHDLGSVMHHIPTAELLVALKDGLATLQDDEVPVGRAYAAGFLCHYALDSNMHPFVFAQQYTLCDAGIDGLDRSQGDRVHAEIERELDEIVLFSKLGETVGTYKPYVEVLGAADETLDVIGKLYTYMAIMCLHQYPSTEAFGAAVRNFRMVQRFFYSPDDVMQNVANSIETKLLGRSFSQYKSMSHRNNPSEVSEFDNRQRQTWMNPFTERVSNTSFWDIYGNALEDASAFLTLFLSDGFDLGAARGITGGINFDGEPTE